MHIEYTRVRPSFDSQVEIAAGHLIGVSKYLTAISKVKLRTGFEGRGKRIMKIAVSTKGIPLLQVSNEELEQLRYCADKVVEGPDTMHTAAISFSLQDCEQFAKYLKTSAKANPDGPGFELLLNKFDLDMFLTCTSEIAEVFQRYGDESGKPTYKQIRRLCDQLGDIIDQVVTDK